MEDQFYVQRCEAQSQMILTLKRQIDGLLPLRASFNNLQQYYDKITADFQSLISEHNYVNEALKQSKQNLTLIGMRTQEDRNSLITKLENVRNQHTKLTIETKSTGQKMQIMTEKLKLQSNRSEQNLSYRSQLQQMLQALKSHIQSLQVCLQDLKCSIECLTDKLRQTQISSEKQATKNKELAIKGQQTKDRIARLDIQNDDLVDGNRKLADQIRSNEEQLNIRHKVNREARQKIIGLTADLEKLKHQSDYKRTLIQAEKTAQIELQNHQLNIIKAVENVSEQKQIVNKQSRQLQAQIQEMQKARQQNINFQLNSEQHLNEIKRANDSLFLKMQNYCLQDREIQSILLRKMSSLQACSRRFNKMAQFKHEQSLSANLRQHLIFKERRLNDNPHLYERGIWSKKDQMNEAHNTRSSEKSPWRKENFA